MRLLSLPFREFLMSEKAKIVTKEKISFADRKELYALNVLLGHPSIFPFNSDLHGKRAKKLRELIEGIELKKLTNRSPS